MLSTCFTSFVSMYSFSQANFTFHFVENLRTYSETWLRMSEAFRTSGNVLTVSRLQVGELWETFLFSSFFVVWSRQYFYACRTTNISDFRFKRSWKRGRLTLDNEPIDWCWETSDMKILKTTVASLSPVSLQYHWTTGEIKWFWYLFVHYLCLPAKCETDEGNIDYKRKRVFLFLGFFHSTYLCVPRSPLLNPFPTLLPFIWNVWH